MAESDSRRATSESPPDWQPTGFVFDDNGWAARLRATDCDMVIKSGSIATGQSAAWCPVGNCVS
jgi:hypothetical protein